MTAVSLVGRIASARADRVPVDTPWPYTAVLVAAGFGVAAVTLLVTAWAGASRQADPARQVVWLNVGMLAVSVLGSGCATWLLIGRRAVAGRSRAAQLAAAQALGLLGGEVPAVLPSGELVTVAGLTRRHLPTCPLVAGRTTTPATGALSGCGVCGA